MEEVAAPLDRARALVLRHGWNATAYQIINPGIEYWFTPGDEGVVAFVLGAGFRIVAGAPVCAEEQLTAVRIAFEADAASRGERVCYFGAESRLERALCDSPAHSSVLLGAQPSFDPAEWPEMTRGHASLRAQFKRARNKEVHVEEWSGDAASGDLRLRGCLGEWLDRRGLPPLHFLVEPETLDRLRDRRVFVAERNNSPIAFLVASPIPRRNGWLIEQIVRGRDAPNGTAELLIDTVVRAVAADGSKYVTLGLSPLSRHASAGLDCNPRWLRWLLAWMRAHGRRFYNFEGLDAFKRKFHPTRWEPVYAISNEPRFSPRALWAITHAFTGGHPIRLGLRALATAVARELMPENGRLQ